MLQPTGCSSVWAQPYLHSLARRSPLGAPRYGPSRICTPLHAAAHWVLLGMGPAVSALPCTPQPTGCSSPYCDKSQISAFLKSELSKLGPSLRSSWSEQNYHFSMGVLEQPVTYRNEPWLFILVSSRHLHELRNRTPDAAELCVVRVAVYRVIEGKLEISRIKNLLPSSVAFSGFTIYCIVTKL
jgi:hypothetical protein